MDIRKANERTETMSRIKRRTRAAFLLVSCVLLTGALAGTAWGGTSVWQDVWLQIKPLLSEPGTINQTDNPVHWTKLKGVPAGLADGLDNGVDRPGFGLKKNIYPNLEFAVDTTKIQQRITEECPSGQAVRSIGVAGAVTCTTGPRALSTYSTDTGIICNDWCTEASLALEPGSYAVWAKIGGRQPDLDEDLFLECRLDTNGWAVDQGVLAGDVLGVLPLQGVVSLFAPTDLALVCRDENIGDVHGMNAQIMAIRVE